MRLDEGSLNVVSQAAPGEADEADAADASFTARKAQVEHDPKSVQGFSAGDRVQGRWKQPTSSWYPGHITKVNTDGTYAVQFDDGDFEPNQPIEWLKSGKSESASLVKPAKLATATGAGAQTPPKGKQRVVPEERRALSVPVEAEEQQEEEVVAALGMLNDLLYADTCQPAAPDASASSAADDQAAAGNDSASDSPSARPLLCCNMLEKDGGAFGCTLAAYHSGAHGFVERKPRNRPAAWVLRATALRG